MYALMTMDPPLTHSETTSMDHWVVSDDDLEYGCVGDVLSVTFGLSTERWWVELRYPDDLIDKGPRASYDSFNDAVRGEAARLQAQIQKRSIQDMAYLRALAERFDL